MSAFHMGTAALLPTPLPSAAPGKAAEDDSNTTQEAQRLEKQVPA